MVDDRSIDRHYGTADIAARIQAALRGVVDEETPLTVEDLASFDEFHVGGLTETLALAELAGVRPGAHVLDVGSGVGGPARILADRFGCRVTGLDVTKAFCEAAAMLTSLVGLDERVDFRHGSALDMPFDDATFDVVWLQHATMNIADEATLYREIARVLRPGGRLALHEILAGPSKQPVHFPVFWASEPYLSALSPPERVRAHIESAGLTITEWTDTSERSAALQEKRHVQSAPDELRRLGLEAIVPDDVPQKAANVLRNLREGNIVVVQAVARKPAAS